MKLCKVKKNMFVRKFMGYGYVCLIYDVYTIDCDFTDPEAQDIAEISRTWFIHPLGSWQADQILKSCSGQITTAFSA